MTPTNRRLQIDSLEELQNLWESHRADEDSIWLESRYVQAGKRARGYGHRALADDILTEGAQRYSKDPEIAYAHALVLADGGAIEAASMVEELLASLPENSPIRVDALALKGRIAKDRFFNLAPESRAAKRALRESIAAYGEAYTISGDSFPGINEASTRRLAGQKLKVGEVAQAVKSRCLAQEAQCKQPDHWLCATIAEASLLLDQNKEAARYYRKALKHARDKPGDADVIRRQVNRLSTGIEIPSVVKAALKIGPVVMFTGHMIDAPGKQARFPEEIVDAARAAIGDALDAIGPAIGYCSLACGGDLLFFNEMQKRNLELRAYLPFERKDFERESVAFAGENWVEHYRRAHRSARRTLRYAVRDGYLGDDCLFDYNNQLMHGEALLQARSWGTECVLLALLDPDSDRHVGGAAATVTQWNKLGGRVKLIDLKAIREKAPRRKRVVRRSLTQAGSQSSGGPKDLPHGRRSIRTMLFADMVGFSKLREPQIPVYFELYLHKVEQLLSGSGARMPFFNTWGDGLYLVFNDVEDAADFSLRLRDAIRREPWAKHDLPPETNIRIAMHTGPVFRGHDPVLRRTNVFGAHVNHAARIEPVTLPGTVCVSEQTAAILTATGDARFACDYLGSVEFAKKYGAFVLYRLRRAGQAD